MDRYRVFKAVVVAGLTVALQGCFQEKLEEMVNHETISFQGTYSNQYNSNTLMFSKGVMNYKMDDHLVTREYKVEDSHLFIKLANSSKEKREDIVMRIHGEGEVLTCSTCAKYNMVNIWVKDDFVAPEQEMILNNTY
ncbi:hypothetical protein KP803_12670 [Vibrio sp. ZSDE26]|uniref:Lipoprotein n=1 Tax=Vibrio amylolyticus TaxID=2847292 RepID=A0A9X2BHM0_9VIBR|nr:hypothetical protein [Vibrio amylolyticus]MCK6264126.1 hypothetical protein [Vibrio amylolyticus]